MKLKSLKGNTLCDRGEKWQIQRLLHRFAGRDCSKDELQVRNIQSGRQSIWHRGRKRLMERNDPRAYGQSNCQNLSLDLLISSSQSIFIFPFE